MVDGFDLGSGLVDGFVWLIAAVLFWLMGDLITAAFRQAGLVCRSPVNPGGSIRAEGLRSWRDVASESARERTPDVSAYDRAARPAAADGCSNPRGNPAGKPR